MSSTYPRQFAGALGQAGAESADLGDEETAIVLELAREVAHGSERRFAPLSTFLAGRFVGERTAHGTPPGEALAEAVAIARRLLTSTVPADLPESGPPGGTGPPAG